MRHVLALSLLVLVPLAACKTAGPVPAAPVATPAPAVPAIGPDPGFLAAWSETGRFRQGRPVSIQVAPDGEVLFLRSGPRSYRRDLFSYDSATGTERLLLSAEALLGGEETISADEAARRERLRLVARGIATYGLSKDGTKLLVPLSGRLFVVERKGGAVRELTAAAGDFLDPRFSPDGKAVALVRDGDLHVVDVATGQLRRLTRRASPEVTNGLAEFVAQEEMGRMEGHWWSPDGKAIAFEEVDVTGVGRLHIPDPFRPDRAPASWPYPRAGERNAAVRLGIVPAAGGRPVWIDWDRVRYPYLATVRWQANAPLTVLVQDRAQGEEVLLAVDARTGKTTPLLVERDSAWLNLDPDLPRWLPDGSGFLWMTERDGAAVLELRGRDGALVRTLTPPSLGYDGFVALEGDEAWVLACEEPTETHLVRVPLDGAGPARFSTEPGDRRGAVVAHGLAVAPVDLAAGGHRVPVRRLDGTAAGELANVAEAPPFAPSVELVRLGGELDLRAGVVRPRGFDPALRYPVLLHVYGGPGMRMVSASRDRWLLPGWLADHGMIVVSIDGRGTPGRGRAFERAIRGQLLEVPLADQVAGLRALGARFPELDLDRVGAFGWSFGGTFAAMAVLARPDAFAAAVAVAPVTDWRDYDTHYTERYLGLPAEAPEAYAAASPLTHAAALSRPLLIVHGTADDNVAFTHSLELSDALFRAGKPHVFLPLGGFTHIVPEPAAAARLHERIAGFLVEHLGRPEPVR